MNELTPGTPCYLVGLTDQQWLLGRVVEIVRGPVLVPDDAGQWFEIAAEWLRYTHPGNMVIAPRECLRPITPPEPVPPAAPKCIPEMTD